MEKKKAFEKIIQMSINEWIKKYYTHTCMHMHTNTIDYYQTFKKKEILPCAIT